MTTGIGLGGASYGLWKLGNPLYLFGEIFTRLGIETMKQASQDKSSAGRFSTLFGATVFLGGIGNHIGNLAVKGLGVISGVGSGYCFYKAYTTLTTKTVVEQNEKKETDEKSGKSTASK